MKGLKGDFSMIYCSCNGVIIRDMEMKDVEILTEGERAQGWHWASPEKSANRLIERDAGRCVVMVCEFGGEPAGYVSLYWNAEWGAFKGMHIPEIMDLNVLIRFRRRGLASRMMTVCEQLAATRCDKVCLGVGLYRDYGAAQRLYVKRGYVPDGTGLWYADENVEPGKTVSNDDDLVLFLSKDLPESSHSL